MRKFRWGKWATRGMLPMLRSSVNDEAQYITGQELIVDGGITSSTGRTRFEIKGFWVELVGWRGDVEELKQYLYLCTTSLE
jgi:hypothetical protein